MLALYVHIDSNESEPTSPCMHAGIHQFFRINTCLPYCVPARFRGHESFTTSFRACIPYTRFHSVPDNWKLLPPVIVNSSLLPFTSLEGELCSSGTHMQSHLDLQVTPVRLEQTLGLHSAVQSGPSTMRGTHFRTIPRNSLIASSQQSAL